MRFTILRVMIEGVGGVRSTILRVMIEGVGGVRHAFDSSCDIPTQILGILKTA